jgi:hypothetical protein
MRSAELLLLAAFVALVGLGLWNFRSWLPVAGHSVTTVVAKGAPVPHPTSKRAGTKAGKSGHSLEGFELPLGPMSVSTMEIHVNGAPFPTPKDLIAGMSREQILSLFGDPVVRVTGEKEGELFEKLYYVNDEHTLATVADLLGGFVVSAESKRL